MANQNKTEQDKQKAIIDKILACKETLGLDTLPTARQLAGFGIHSNQLMSVGGLTKISKITKIPMKGRAYARGKKRKSYRKRRLYKKSWTVKKHLESIICQRLLSFMKSD